MNAFTSSLVLESLRPSDPLVLKTGRAWYILADDLTYISERFGKIVAPKGLLTDFASVPRAAWLYLSPNDPVIEYPSVIHDAIYQVGGKVGERNFSRAEADEILAEAMAACGARWGQKKVVLNAVRMFGGSHWKD